MRASVQSTAEAPPRQTRAPGAGSIPPTRRSTSWSLCRSSSTARTIDSGDDLPARNRGL